jgi:hypothetical protein
MKKDKKMNQPTLETELAQIPAAYQKLFRESIEREIVEHGRDRTDSDKLAYLRKRQNDMKNGAYITPDGEPALVDVDPDTIHQNNLGRQNVYIDDAEQRERRQTFMKIGAVALAALLGLLFWFRGRAVRADAAEAAIIAETEATAAAATAVSAGLDSPPTATPPLPEVAAADNTLETIGNLGGKLTLGRPASLEIVYRQNEEKVALAIDPSLITKQGELQFQESVMTSDNPVAVWVFGTVVNYAIGIPDAMIRNLSPGDWIILNTDTGDILRFVVTEILNGDNYDTSQYLSQDHIGLTLFSLPAQQANQVGFALASYDISQESASIIAPSPIGEPVPLGGYQLTIHDFTISHTLAGDASLVISGTLTGQDAINTIIVSLSGRQNQTEALTLNPSTDTEKTWEIAYQISDDFLGGEVLAEFRTLPGGDLATISLGRLSQLNDALNVQNITAHWDSEKGEGIILIHMLNSGVGDVWVQPDFVHATIEGGAHDAIFYQLTPALPVQLVPGEELHLRLAFLPPTASATESATESAVILLVGDQQWEIQLPDLPAEEIRP